MKKYLLPFLIVLAGCADTLAPRPKDGKHSNDTYTQKNKEMKTDVANKPMTCKLTSPESRNRKAQEIARLKEEILETRDLPDGFAYRLSGSDENLDLLSAFIKSERMCCDFFDFKVLVSHDASMWLEISGAEGVKEFIKSELGM